MDKNDQVYPPGYPVPQQESGGILDPLLNLVGLKETPQPIDEYPSHYHDPYEYDYGDYIEGYQNHVKPIHAYTISERIAKWFTGFKIPSAKHVSFDTLIFHKLGCKMISFPWYYIMILTEIGSSRPSI